MVSSNIYTVCAPNSPTHFPYNTQHRLDVLDISLINLPHYEFTITNHNELSSDHNLITISINDSIITSRPPAVKKRTNWKKFELKIDKSISKTKKL